jgi:hypothetical protein
MSSESGAVIADWALPPNGGPPTDDNTLWKRIAAWWAEFTLQTKLLAVATLVVSLMMTGITFFALSRHPTGCRHERHPLRQGSGLAPCWQCHRARGGWPRP